MKGSEPKWKASTAPSTTKSAVFMAAQQARERDYVMQQQQATEAGEEASAEAAAVARALSEVAARAAAEDYTITGQE